ncbi:NAD(P)/FAD-dependent oxidoreductase [Amycolatopsis benzoatilytica]|uniref:NAD(P)/FAD-dependent oxidoreductase n=1 Tax=Amycolatopsis benzoatilytica TaxID=346045 RepID=UPI00035F433A|nr:FAD-dependent oxidoreductase [Amycolatopsis benzoatilytica]
MREAGLVVVGASLAGLRAASTARRAGYDGPVTLIGAEPHLPYDRPPLSKAFLADPDYAPPLLTDAGMLAELRIDLRLGEPASGLSLAEREVLIGQSSVPFDSLILATGCAPVVLPGLEAGHPLRTLDDARAIRDRIPATDQAVIVGGGFIGAELASALRERGAKVTIVEAADVPLVRAVGTEMAGVLASLHHRNGVDLRCGTTVTALDPKVTLSDGSVLDADLVVVGIGARPAVGWLDDSGIPVHDGVLCDETLCAAPGIYAAGDVARWHNPLFEATMRLENWTSAVAQAEAAARNAVGPAASPFETVPYFWSDWYGNRIQMVGVVTGDVTLLGHPEDQSWLALYRAGDRLAGALALNQPGRIMKYRNRIAGRANWRDALEFAAAVR